MRAKWIVLWSLWVARLVRQPTLVVRVSGGLLRGSIAPNGHYMEYLAIPYATLRPEMRFKTAGPEPKWEGIFEAINENVRCPQRVGKRFLIGQLDCLTLNIFTPIDATPASKLPVMVFIHGGGFYEGSGTKFLYGPDYLVHKGVILITLNYRLNIQGFACLRIREAAGNAGMKDQVAALAWIRRNLRAFGGDIENVTLFGESAGATSVSYHVLSPMSKGLFHKAIIQSGSSLLPWALQYKPVYMASLLTNTMGYETQDPQQLYDILMNKTDAELIITRIPRQRGNVIISECIYVPCAEHRIDGVEPFLTDIPYNMLTEGKYNKVPMIIGSNNEEGYLFGSMENDTTIPRIEFKKSLPKDLSFPKQEKRNAIAEELQKLYMGDMKISPNAMLKLSKFYGEAYFAYGIREEIEHIIKTSDRPVYSYLFKYDGWRNLVKASVGEPYSDLPGATHADDLFYLFSQPLLPSFFENKMINRMTTLWTNFAKYGDPTPEVSELLPFKWLPTNTTTPQSLVIDGEFSSAPLWYSDSLKYLKQIYTKYRRKG